MSSRGVLEQLLRFSNWANIELLRACSLLTPDQLDSVPGGEWSVRKVLVHIVEAQQGYLALLSGEPLGDRESAADFPRLISDATDSGEGLFALAADESLGWREPRIRSIDGYVIEPWVVMVQAVNHANDHRRQICGMLRDLGVTPPRIDGWGYGDATGAIEPLEK